MPRKRSDEKHIRKLTRAGGGRSFGVTLPIDWIRRLGWREHQKLALKLQKKEIVVKDWEK